MFQQLGKLMDLVRLVVQKLEIQSEIVVDDTVKCSRAENQMKMQRFRQTLSSARRFNHARPGTSAKIPNFCDPVDG